VYHQLQALLTAIAFFTRIPAPAWVDQRAAQPRAACYAPIAGWVVGAAAALAFALAATVLSPSLAALAALLTGVLLTGALHEDGFADFCDALGAGPNRERALEIMHDPRVGAFGVLGLALMVLVKFIALVDSAALLGAAGSASGLLALALVLVTGHSLSRLAAVAFMHTHEYVRPEPDARSRAMAAGMPAAALAFAVVTGTAPLVALAWLVGPELLAAALPCVLAWALLARLLTRRLDGYTGDCLGAAQQVTETLFYVGASAMLRLS